MSARKTVVHPAPPRDEGEGSSETNQVTAAGQDAEAVLPSGTSPGAAQEKVPAVSSDKDGSATSAFESVPAGAAEGQGAGASKEERGPSEKPRGDEAAAEGTNEDAEALASLFSGEGGTPPEDVMQWINGEGELATKANAEKAHQRGLTWLKAALPLAHKHPKVKGWIKRFLAVGDFTRNMGYMQIFDPLQAFCRERLLAVGRPLQAFYRDSEEVRGLAELYPDTLEGLASQGHLRQDHPLVGLSPPASFHMDTFEGESRYIHYLRLAALALNEPYQKMVEEAAGKGEHKPCNIKGDARMRNKALAADDHRYEAKPRPAHNIDILRCCVTFEDVASMRKGIEGLVALARKGCGGVGRVKNGFALSDAEAAKSFHYRSWMMNMVVDFGQTFGEMLSKEKAAGLLDKYLRAPPENPDEPWGRWRRDAQAAAEALRSGEMSRRPAVMVCEVQVLLKPYLEARREMHLLYKIARAASAAHLATQFRVQEGRAEDATWSTEEQLEVEFVRRNVETRFELTLYDACFGGFPKAVEAALKVDWVKREPNRANKDGGTPLYIACQNGHLDVVRMLLSVDGIDPNRANANKQTPVNTASDNGHLEIVRLLLTLPGLDITTEDKWGDAPEASARKKGHTAVASLLREHASAAAAPAE